MQEKLALLLADPRPDAKVKKQLRHLDGKLHRLRSGDHRIFYTFDDRYVSALALRRRKEDTYDESVDAEFLGGLDPELAAKSRAQAGSQWIAPPTAAPARVARPLPGDKASNAPRRHDRRPAARPMRRIRDVRSTLAVLRALLLE